MNDIDTRRILNILKEANALADEVIAKCEAKLEGEKAIAQAA